jgi:hypothetical protein
LESRILREKEAQQQNQENQENQSSSQKWLLIYMMV